jgi:cbb3-type cytochrome oxidase subunit 3
MTARERRIRSKWGLLFLLTGLIALWLAFRSHNQERFVNEAEQSNIVLQDSIFKLNKVIDSLHDESFNEFTINGRYELSLEHLKEVNPKAAQEFENFMNTQTE